MHVAIGRFANAGRKPISPAWGLDSNFWAHRSEIRGVQKLKTGAPSTWPHMALPLVCTLLWKLGFGSPGSVRSRTEVRRPFCLEEMGGWEESKRDQGRGWAVQKVRFPSEEALIGNWRCPPQAVSLSLALFLQWSQQLVGRDAKVQLSQPWGNLRRASPASEPLSGPTEATVNRALQPSLSPPPLAVTPK